MYYRFPVGIPNGENVILTQGFRSNELAEWYKSKGLNYPVHTAIDIVTSWNPLKTHGAPIVCPNPDGADLISASEARLQVEWKEADGSDMLLGFLHLSELVVKRHYNFGDVMGYIGNIGYVRPEPTIGKPFDGSHLHLTIVRNGVVDDPLKYFNLSNPFRMADTGVERDLPAIVRAIEWIRQALRKQGITPVAGKPRPTYCTE